MAGGARAIVRYAFPLACLVAAAGAARAEPSTGIAPPPRAIPAIRLSPGEDAPLVGWLSRADGTMPDADAAARDRAACLMDGKVMTSARMRAILRLSRSDPADAYRRTVGALVPCMARRGWRTDLCGAGEDEACDPAPGGMAQAPVP